MWLFNNPIEKLRYLSRPALPILWHPMMFTFLSSIGLMLTKWEAGDRFWDEKIKLSPNEQPYDFIIVGAGSSGSVLAYRLSEFYSVLLLEAGGEPNPMQDIPGFGLLLMNYPEVDWMHRTVPQKHSCLSSRNQESSWSAGLGLGGSGNLNLMIHLRGHKLDFDNWAKITGDPSWSWEGVLPYFKKYEDYRDGGDPKYHGYGGPLRIETPDYVSLANEFVMAGAEMGYPPVDLNGPFDEGFDVLKFPMKFGRRQAPYHAFIQTARKRKNLTIRKFSYVTRVLFRDGNIAYGVEYDRHGERRIATASKEVILSAGTITTPRILMVSGIGPAEHLSELGIPVRQNLPVGESLQDHISAYLGPFFIDNPKTTVLLERDLTPLALLEWFNKGTGIMTSPGVNAAGIISSSAAKSRGEGNWPDIVLYMFGYSVFQKFAATVSHAFHLKIDEITKYYKHAIGKESFLLAISGARPLSKGTIRLGGSSPYDKLIIDPNYLNDPGNVDITAMVDGMKTAVYMMENTTTLGKELGVRFTQQILPGCEHVPFRSDEYWECYARRFSVTLHHPVGTCGMGRVVDPQLRVYGIQNLRVIDASIQPEIIVANTQASALMIGEKGADMILQFWKLNQTEEHGTSWS